MILSGGCVRVTRANWPRTSMASRFVGAAGVEEIVIVFSFGDFGISGNYSLGTNLKFLAAIGLPRFARDEEKASSSRTPSYRTPGLPSTLLHSALASAS